MGGFKLITTRQHSLEMQSSFEEHLNKLENLIIDCNTSLWAGVKRINDITYNTCMEYLNLLHKDSPLLQVEDKQVVDISSLTEKNLEYLNTCLNGKETLQFMLNPQGLGVRLSYESGELISAVTLGRSAGGRDITGRMQLILGDRNEFLETFDNIELEGVLVLPLSHVDYAMEYAVIEDAHTGVFALLKDDIDEEALELLHFICTDILMSDNPFRNMTDRLSYIESLGLLIPEVEERENTGEIKQIIEDVVYTFDFECSEYDYKTDGIRLIVDADTLVMLKLGKWKSYNYRGIIEKVEWVDKKGKKIPKLKFNEPIQIDDTVEISEVLLQSVNLLLILSLASGSVLNFRYIGDLGVLPVMENGEFILLN